MDVRDDRLHRQMISDEDGFAAGGRLSMSSSLIFLGTGCSAGVPKFKCLSRPTDPPCPVCTPSLSIPPEKNPNYRCNTSLLIDYCKEGLHNYILIDCGKSFREQVLRWFTHHKIPQADCIILTHEHADAVLGLDDFRAVQVINPSNDTDPTPVYLTQYAMNSIAGRFPYLIKRKLKEGEELRFVAQLDWKIIEGDLEKPFVALGLEFTPLPVIHGEDYVSLGFLFGQSSRVAYISDISRFPATTEYFISKSGAGQVDILILDCNCKEGPNRCHLSLQQSLDAVRKICPKRAFLTGMNHGLDHHEHNKMLAEWSIRQGIPVQLAHDGLRIPIYL